MPLFDVSIDCKTVFSSFRQHKKKSSTAPSINSIQFNPSRWKGENYARCAIEKDSIVRLLAVLNTVGFSTLITHMENLLLSALGGFGTLAVLTTQRVYCVSQ